MRYFDVEIDIIDPFGSGASVYCNKLQQFEPLLAKPADVNILCDADLAFLESPAGLIDNMHIRAKLVDKPNPNEEALVNLLKNAGFPHELVDAIPAYKPTSRTHRLNCNGGLYTIPHIHLRALASCWLKWSKFCLARPDILGKWHHHSDQLGFMLSMIELELPFSPLSEKHNFPIHFAAKYYEGGDIYHDLCILHYHAKLDENGKITDTGVQNIDVQIAKVNTLLSTFDQNSHYQAIKSAYKYSLDLHT